MQKQRKKQKMPKQTNENIPRNKKKQKIQNNQKKTRAAHKAIITKKDKMSKNPEKSRMP